VAGLSFHQDYNAQGVPDWDIGGRAESGAVGLGLIGTLLAQVGPRALASSIAITGAAFSIYSNFIARGANVVLPANTAVKISLKARDVEAGTATR
jgi:heme/copper-type cytochrome/quinol oxidase subunit 2